MTMKALWVEGWATLAWVKATHKLVTKGRLQPRASYGTRDMSQDTAQGSRLPSRNNGKTSTGSTNATGFSHIVQGIVGNMHLHNAGTTSEAIDILKNRLQRGISADSHTYDKVLRMCLKENDLLGVKQVHDCIIESGMDKNPYVANILLNVYIKCGGLLDARRVFDELKRKSVVTWNMMIAGYAKKGHTESALELFNRMRQEGARANEVTYVCILKACASPLALKWGKEVHVCITHAGFESDVRVGTALLQMYAKCGCITEARRVFENLTNRNFITWNVMIGAYAATGSLDDARLLFDRMENRDLVTWNIMIGAYIERGRGVEAYRLFLQMRREGFEPDAITFMSILNASASAGALEWVKEVHVHARKAGMESDLRVGNALVHMYAKCRCIKEARRVFDKVTNRDFITWNAMIGAYAASGSLDEARVLFDRMDKRNVITWNILIGAYAERGRGMEAYRLYLQMRQEGFEPNSITYMSILNASASAGALEWVREVHSHALKAGLESDTGVGTALLQMYAKCGCIKEARRVFEKLTNRNSITWNVMISSYAASGNMDNALQMFARMENRDVFTWNIMIGANAERGRGVEAYRLFLQMGREGFKPDAITYMSILNASARAGALEWVKDVHGHARKAGLDSDLRVGNALVHMYAKSGSIDDARLVFDRMEERDVVSWNTMIGGLAQHGCVHEALELFSKMNADHMEPDGTSFVAVLSACCHAGLLDEGRRLFLAMTQEFGIEPDIVHYTCMVDLLGRAGHIEEAKLFIIDMPVKPHGVTWRALLGACRTHGNVELGEFAAKELFKLEPNNASAYVLLSNIYAAAGKWEKVSMVRTMMQKRGVRKEPGRSWIEVDNKIHDFVVGDTSHPEAKAIYTELDKLTEKLKTEGYTPNTQLVLQNIDEEDKELALCSHSEKLAIVYGLMHIPSGKPIRVYKNLRVCSDCHTATKLISKVTGREIIARDANRFHHFKDGLCSCGDYW